MCGNIEISSKKFGTSSNNDVYLQRQLSIRATQRCDPQRQLTTIARAEQSKKTFPARLYFYQMVTINYNTGYAIERYEDLPHYAKLNLNRMMDKKKVEDLSVNVIADISEVISKTDDANLGLTLANIASKIALIYVEINKA